MKDKISSRAWVGCWGDGNPGWGMPGHIDDWNETLRTQAKRDYVCDGDVFYRCKVTVELLKDKRGRYITKKARKEER
jgi:hypothetical protein